MKKQWSNRSLMVVIVVGALVVLCLVVSRPKRLTARLANGTEISVLAVTHGASNLFFPGGIRDELIYKFAPAKGIAFGPIKIGPVSPMTYDMNNGHGSPAFTNRMVVWIGHDGPSNAPLLPVPEARWFNDLRATVADEKGEEWEMRWGGAYVNSRTGHGWNGVSSWPFTSFPRRGKTLRLRIYAVNNLNQLDTLADFTLPNPTPGPYPTWQPAKLPDTQKIGDLEVSPVKLVSKAMFGAHVPGYGSLTTATFEVKENGQPTEAWLPNHMEATDATGNELFYTGVNISATNRLVSYSISGGNLSPSEVWRMRVRFDKLRNPEGKLTWTSPELAVRDGDLEAVNLTTNLESFRITLSRSKNQDSNTIRLKMDPPPKNTLMRWAEIVDDRGRTVKYGSGSIEDSALDAQWRIPDGAEWIKITTSLWETREFEFLAQPTAIIQNDH